MPPRALTILLLSGAFSCCAQAPSPQRAVDAQDLQTAYCPQTHQLEVAPSQKFFLEGTLGGRHIRMYLDRGGSGVVGLFFEPGGSWDIIQFGGTWDKGKIDVSDEAENHPATGHLKASLVDNRLTGIWTAANSNQAEPVDLATIPEPRCDGKEPWKRFEDPKTRASFAYPASWHLAQDREGIWLTCPDPAKIAYNQGITIRMGPGSYQSPPELLQCGDKWIYGSECDCNHPDKIGCQITTATHTGSATVLDISDHEWRTYCRDGGYVGQSYGKDRMVLLPHGWMEILADGDLSEITDRVIGTLREGPPSQSK